MDTNNNIYNIEIQSSGNKHFRNRSLYYWSRLYSSEIKEADDYRKLNPVICINILDYNLFTESDKIHNCFLLREKDRGFVLTNHQVIHFIELPKLQNHSISGHLDQWMLFDEQKCCEVSSRMNAVDSRGLPQPYRTKNLLGNLFI